MPDNSATLAIETLLAVCCWLMLCRHDQTALTASKVSQSTPMSITTSHSKKCDRQGTACCAWPVAPAASN
jgi:hypothetical protein